MNNIIKVGPMTLSQIGQFQESLLIIAEDVAGEKAEEFKNQLHNYCNNPRILKKKFVGVIPVVRNVSTAKNHEKFFNSHNIEVKFKISM